MKIGVNCIIYIVIPSTDPTSVCVWVSVCVCGYTLLALYVPSQMKCFNLHTKYCCVVWLCTKRVNESKQWCRRHRKGRARAMRKFGLFHSDLVVMHYGLCLLSKVYNRLILWWNAGRSVFRAYFHGISNRAIATTHSQFHEVQTKYPDCRLFLQFSRFVKYFSHRRIDEIPKLNDQYLDLLTLWSDFNWTERWLETNSII